MKYARPPSPSTGRGLTISNRIRVGFGALIVIALMLSATGWWGSQMLGDYVDEVASLNQQTERVMGATLALSRMNEAVAQYTLDHQDTALATARGSAAEAARQLAEVIGSGKGLGGQAA